MNNKPILIAIATAPEVAPFLKQFRMRSYEGPSIDLVITGPGLVATTYSLTRQIAIARPSLIIQAGIAGCFDTRMALGTVVAVERDLVADQGVMEKKEWKTIFDLGLAADHKTPYTDGWIVNTGAIFKRLSLDKVRGVSVNQVTTSRQAIRLLKTKFNPVVESMEGAALHFVATREKLPFVQLRAVSNYIGERNKKKWKLEQAIENLNHELNHLLGTL